MRIDCYNATECELATVIVGDTFYFDGTLCMKVDVNNVELIPPSLGSDRCYIVELDTGYLRSVKNTALVIMADTKVVTNTKDV